MASTSSLSESVTDAAARTVDAPRLFADDAQTSGRVPNVFWRAVALDDLRSCVSFVGLPEESRIVIAGRRSFASVRQGTALWDALHDGRLTTGLLKNALGFCEPACDRRALGMSSRGHGGGISSVVSRLRRERVGVDDVDAALASEAARANAEATETFNRERASAARAASAAECDSDDAAVEITADASMSVGSAASAMDIMLASLLVKPATPKSSKGKKKKNGKSKKRNSKTNRAVGDDAAMLTNAQYCRALAKGGEMAIRLAWGSEQEASTLCSLMCHFTGSTVYEAGLCMLDPADIPSDWNVGPLPPVGASPDGLITLASGERFAVEVKNSSPFREMPGSYVIADREPYDKPPAYHMAQVQLEMICTNTRSALLAMQSMTYGIRVFRVERDDAFVASMLRRISRLYASYILKDREPPTNWEIHSADHKSMVRSAVRLAREATVFCHVPTGLLPDSIVVDERPFIA